MSIPWVARAEWVLKLIKKWSLNQRRKKILSIPSKKRKKERKTNPCLLLLTHYYYIPDRSLVAFLVTKRLFWIKYASSSVHRAGAAGGFSVGPVLLEPLQEHAHLEQ